MHAERFSISAEAADNINDAARIVAVGTTAVRVLEAATLQTGRQERIVGQAHRLRPTCGAPVLQISQTATCGGRQIQAQSGETDLFIYPPFTFRVVDALLTNFHLPRSTLLMLVSAFAGREFILRAYDEAVRYRYRFYSYGDCMLIL
jgi:S-adenosylmethionine:tRNA ribosyltransferase-isomerase